MPSHESKIRHIIFDVGGLFEKEMSDEIAAYLAKEFNIPEDEFVHHYLGIEPRVLEGKVSLQQAYAMVLELLKRDDISRLLMEKHIEYYQEHSTLDERLFELVRKLKRTHTVSALTNTEIEIAEHNKKRGLFKEFHKAFISTDIGLRKPDEKIFAHVLKELGAKPEEAVFIDDKMKYVEGARKMGMHAIHYTSYEQLEKDLYALL